MQKIELFSTPLWITSIDPTTYDKEEIIKVVESNYDKQPIRVVGEHSVSNLHHYYDDWDNPKFHKPNLDKLCLQYSNIINEFIKTIKFQKSVSYNYNVVNITVMKAGQFFDEHDHYDANNLNSPTFSCVHYIKHNNENSPLIFKNPLIFAQYVSSRNPHSSFLDSKAVENSSYYYEQTINVREDSFIIFPSYLKHLVRSTDKTTDSRISIAINIYFKEVK